MARPTEPPLPTWRLLLLCGAGALAYGALSRLWPEADARLSLFALGLALLFPLSAWTRARGRRGARALLWVGVLGCWALAAPRLSDSPGRALLAFLLGGSLLAGGLAPPQSSPRRARRLGAPWWEPVLHDPARLLVVSFLLSGLAGGALLSLPWAVTQPISGLDALFTSFSAVCVTGLIVLDTPVAFTGFGQAAILLLIQVGGLGIMAFSTAALFLMGRRLSLEHEAAVSQLFGEHGGGLGRAVRQVFVITFGVEALGAVVLSGLFWRAGDPLGQAAWRGLFTAISAFCNAGFALQSESLIPYQDSPAILHAVAALIVLGGLGPVVVGLLPHLIRRRRLSPQAKLVLAATALLLIGPALFLAAAEWDRGLGTVSGAGAKLSNAWFQSVTLRTAGFNSIDLTRLGPASITLSLAIMVVGGCPGGTAGGIKTTTAALLFLATWAGVRGRDQVSVFGFRVGRRTIFKAFATVALFAYAAFLALVALQLTQSTPFLRLLFEVISALATVGLSLGATAELDGVGKVIVITCMLAGRVGPLTLFLLLAEPERAAGRWQRPRAEIATG
ncbi:MAG TPA: potassium transporter TrkH [Planctomycetes bacterium]|nr:potassium transporter TrkH [Planctomycetota bacterium]